MATLGQQVLERLVGQLGNPENAAARLDISERLMRRMLAGGLAVPESVLLKAIDILESVPSTGRKRPSDAEVQPPSAE